MGQQDTIYCQNCGQQLRSTAQFCDRCGADVQGADDPQQSAGQPPTGYASPQQPPAGQPGTAQHHPQDPPPEPDDGFTRRQLVAGVVGIGGVGAGALVLAGGDDGPLPGGETEQYEPGNKQALIPDFEQSTIDNDWVRDDSINENFDAVFVSEGEDRALLIDVAIMETIEEAKEGIDDQRQRGGTVHDLNFADDAFWFERDDQARTAFRDSNAIGMVVAIRRSGLEWTPDISRSQQYAEAMYEHWQE